MRIAPLVIALVAAAGCAATPLHTGTTPSDVHGGGESAARSSRTKEVVARPRVPVRWDVRAEPTRLSMSDRGSFRLFLRATNRGTGTVRPDLHPGHFMVNGSPSTLLDLAFSNGIMEPGWMGLSPGQSVETARAVGEGLFSAPGTYVITYTTGSRTSRVTVHVTP